MTLGRSEGMGYSMQVDILVLRRGMDNSLIVTGGKAGYSEGKWEGNGDGNN